MLPDNEAVKQRPYKGCGYVARVDMPELGIAAGDAFPYAELGKHELEAFNMWRAGLLTVAQSDPQALAATPDERVPAEPPKPKRKRAQQPQPTE